MNTFWPKIKENPLFAILVALFLLVITAALILWGRNLYKQNYYIGKSTDIQRTIYITGEGKITAIPDIATVSLGLSTEKKVVADAQAENSKTINSLLEKLKSLGIAKEDIKTANYSIYPTYDYPPSSIQILRGYMVSQDVSVKIRDTEKIDDVLKIAGDLNLNQIGGLTFGIVEILN